MTKAKKKKFYVVWQGRQTGIFHDWSACQAQIQGYGGARYKAFDTRAQAEEAWAGEYNDYVGTSPKIKTPVPTWIPGTPGGPTLPSVCVDAACSGNPGLLEYRGVMTETGEEVFHVGPLEQGTNNVGEFLALVHALALLEKQDSLLPIYSDSKIAIKWVRQRRSNTKLEPSPANDRIFALLQRAEHWLREHSYANSILHWDTQSWGENPADFGRK